MDFLKKINKTTVLGCLAASFVILFVYLICSTIKYSSFDFSVFVTLGIIALLIVTLALNKEAIFKLLLVVYGSYLLVGSLFTTINNLSNTFNSSGVDVFYYLLLAIIGILFVTCGILYLLKYLNKINNINLINILLLIVVVLSVAILVIVIVKVANNKIVWPYIFYRVYEILIYCSVITIINNLENQGN